MFRFTTFPSVDFSKLDFGKLPTEQVERLASRTGGLARDTAYVVIGFGVLTVQQAQVRRRELVKSLGENDTVRQLGLTTDQVEQFVSNIESRLSQLDERTDQLEARLDSAVDSLAAKLPEQATAVLTQAHAIAKTARQQVRGLVRNAA